MKQFLLWISLLYPFNPIYAGGDTLGIVRGATYTDSLKSSSLSFNHPCKRDFTFRKELFYRASENTLVKRKSITNAPCSKFIIPTLCVAYGTAARFNDLPIRRFDKHIAEQVNQKIDRHYGIDNYLQVMPATLAWLLDFTSGIKARHNFRDRTLILATSYAFMGTTVYSIKSLTAVERPRNWGEFDAFPSGHTAVTFTGAHILYKEYKDCSPWIGIGGYLTATAVGVLRVINNAHWVSDVVTGAGLGILSAEIGYMMLPVWHRLLGIEKQKEQFVITPQLGFQSAGLGFVYIF